MAPKPIIVTDIDKDDLSAFISSVEQMTATEVRVQIQWALTADSPAVETALRAIFETPKKASMPRLETAKAHSIAVELPVKKLDGRKSKGAKKDSPLNKGYLKAWEVYQPGVEGVIERITTHELNKRINEGTLVVGNYLHHPKAGWKEVVTATAPQQLRDLDSVPVKLAQAEGQNGN